MTSIETTVGVQAPGEARQAPPVTPGEAVERVRDALVGPANPELTARFEDAWLRASRLRGAAGGDAGAERIRAFAYAADVLVALGAEGQLDSEDVRAATTALAEGLDMDVQSVRLELYAGAAINPGLMELPPLAAAGFQLRLLLALGLFRTLSLWRRSATGQADCVLNVGGEELGRRARAEAKAVLRGSEGLRLLGRSSLQSAPVVRFGQIVGAVVGRAAVDDRERTDAFLREAAQALGPLLERELLLERSRTRERALVASAERRLMRLAFDLHDGPVQEVLVLGAETRQFQQQLYPFVLESHRELAYGRFDDIGSRLVELDRALREIAHSLESKSIVSRPLGEILHREVDAFTERCGIEARLELRGDPESLNSSQRVAVFRAIQEALANVREHSGATEVEIRLRARRNSIDVRIVDNGTGFEVGRALAHAAKRGRLGVVGIGERVRMLGGTFELDSRPGGPTTLAFTLPRVAPGELETIET